MGLTDYDYVACNDRFKDSDLFLKPSLADQIWSIEIARRIDRLSDLSSNVP